MTIAAYQTLYQSSLTFGMRKQMQSEQGKTELEQKLNELSKNKAQLLERVTSIYFRKRNC
jgi:dynein light intermediate chain